MRQLHGRSRKCVAIWGKNVRNFEMRHHLCENNLISNKPIQIYKTRAVCRMSIDLGILNSRDSITMDYYCTLWIFPRRMHRWTCNGYKPPYIRATEVCFTVIVIRGIVDRYDVLVLCAFVICNNGVIDVFLLTFSDFIYCRCRLTALPEA